MKIDNTKILCGVTFIQVGGVKMTKVSKEFIQALNGILNGDSYLRKNLKNPITYYKNSYGNIVGRDKTGNYWSSLDSQADMTAKDWIKVEYIIG